MKTSDIPSRLGQFAWRQITPSTIPLPVIFRHDSREEYLCVQMINIHYLSKFPSDTISYYMKQFPLQYFSITEPEAKLFQFINQFHSNGYLAKSNQLDYSKSHFAYITPFLPFVQFYQFISSNFQLIKNNNLNHFSSKYYKKSILEREKQTLNNKCSTNKMISSSSPDQCKSSNSYCRTILFHEKDIMSFITTSSNDSTKTILCLSVKDIVSTYFPFCTPEEFIQLCRLKQIIRYKPDKSTNSDLSLRLIDIQQLEQYWNFFNKHLSTKTSHNNHHSLTTNSPPLIIDTNKNSSISSSNTIEPSSENNLSSILLQPENLPCQMDTIQLVDDQLIHLETNSLLNQLIEIIEKQENSSENKIDKEQNQFIMDDASEVKKEEETILLNIENKTVKRKRRQSQKCPFMSRRRKRKQSKDQIQWWIDKYSIRPISILLHRVKIPIE